MKKKKNNLLSNKVPVVLGFRMMQSVYSPLIQFYNDMNTRGYIEYCNLTIKFIDDSVDKLKIKDITYFFECNYSFTINQVAKSIFALYNIYYKKVGDNFFLALIKLFDCLKKDLLK